MQPKKTTQQRSRRPFFLPLLGWIILVLMLLTCAMTGLLYAKKEVVIAHLLNHANQHYNGLVTVEKADLSPFRKFPYVSIELTNIKVFETKKKDTTAIIDVQKAYLGFNIWRLLRSDYQLQKLKLENGLLNLVQYENNEFNLIRALKLKTEEKTNTSEQAFTLDLSSIELTKIVIKKTNVSTGIMVETAIKQAAAAFKKTPKEIKLHLDGAFVLNVFRNQKPTYVYHKNLELHTDVVFNKQSQIIDFKKTTVLLEGAAFDLKGTIDVDDEMNANLHFSGRKPNFNLLIGFAPEDLIPTLKSYENRGTVYFDVHIKGKTANNQTPSINANFGCKDGYIKNKEANKVMDRLGFHCTFTNGAQRSAASSVFELKDFGARPEAGQFKAQLKVSNFNSPEIDLQLDSDFDLDFLTKFFKLYDLQNMTGQVLLTMNFHDIIDLQNPEKALEKLNQAYFSKLSIKNLHFRSNRFHLPISQLNVEAVIQGQRLNLSKCQFKLGNNDLSISGNISNIPAVLHKTAELIQADLHVQAGHLDLESLLSTGNKVAPTDEVLSDLKFDIAFRGRANTFIVSRSLPIGNYYITRISTRLKHYQHAIKDFNGVFYINDRDVLIKRLDGTVDGSDVHLQGKIGHYDLWLANHKRGNTEIEVDLISKAIHFKDLFTYKGKNYVPEDYKNEDIKDLKLHGRIVLHYDSILQSADFNLTELHAQLKLHPLRLHGFRGKVHYENGIMQINEFSGNIGNNDFRLNGTWNLASSAATHQLHIQAKRININEIISWNPPATNQKVDHDAGITIFDKPFPNLSIQARINELTYHKYALSNINGRINIKENHFVSLDKMQFRAAGGLIEMSGYFNGSNPSKVYLNPDIKMQGLDLDQLFLKFDNFGQDLLISDNIHGLFTGRITGKILLHNDFTPIIQSSDLQLDVKIENGRLDKFAPMQALSAYVGNKNLDRIRFDKLENRFILKNGWFSFSNMTINSSLGHLEISGTQAVDLQMDYFIRVPLKLVGKAAFNKLFNRKPKDISPEQEDALIIRDPLRRTRFINIRITGYPEDFKISLQKKKNEQPGVHLSKTEDFLFDEIEAELEQP